MNWNSKLPQSLSITAAQLRRNCCMSTCRSAVPLSKGGTAAAREAVDGATAAAREVAPFATQFATRLSVTVEPIGKREDRKMGETSKHASSKHKRKEHRLAEKALARDGSDQLAEAAKKREEFEAAARKAAK
jgi:hypothetical protein